MTTQDKEAVEAAKYNTEKMATEAALKFCNWFLAAHGFLPYGFHGDSKRFWLEGFTAGVEWQKQREKPVNGELNGDD